MPTTSGHTRAILASRVQGTNVYNQQGEQLGKVEDLMLDKLSDNILFAVVGVGGVLGIGEKFHPVPWKLLDFKSEKNGFVIPLTKEALKTAPIYDINELTKNDGIAGKAQEFYRLKSVA